MPAFQNASVAHRGARCGFSLARATFGFTASTLLTTAVMVLLGTL
jgi:hypothetical protein